MQTDEVTETEAETEVFPDDITEKTDYVTQTWVAVDLNFETDESYKEKEQLYVVFDAKFTNRETKTSLTIPGFWYGGKTFTVRFAPTEYGIWDFETVCGTDASLDGKTGTVAANAYKGELAIYRRGFVTTNGTKHFVYADGTPFFYLGDTHWNMYDEEYDKGGLSAGRTGAKSHFKYIVDKRVEQGFTVLFVRHFIKRVDRQIRRSVLVKETYRRKNIVFHRPLRIRTDVGADIAAPRGAVFEDIFLFPLRQIALFLRHGGQTVTTVFHRARFPALSAVNT